MGRWIKLTFSTGELRCYDVDPWLSKGVFQALRDPLLFRLAFIQGGTVCWPGFLDIGPECLWSQSEPWADASPCPGLLPTGSSATKFDPAKAVADMKAFMEKGPALAQAPPDDYATRQRLKAELLEAVGYAEGTLPQAALQEVLSEVRAYLERTGEP